MSDRHARRSSAAILTPITGPRSRKGSIASIGSARGPLDKEALAHVLDEIHTNASRSEALTSFSDFDTNGSSRVSVSGAKDLVSGGITNLYTRLRQSVVAVSSPNSSSSTPRRSSPANVHSQSTAASALTSSDTTRRIESRPAFLNVRVSDSPLYASAGRRTDSVSRSPVSSRRREYDLATIDADPDANADADADADAEAEAEADADADADADSVRALNASDASSIQSNTESKGIQSAFARFNDSRSILPAATASIVEQHSLASAIHDDGDELTSDDDESQSQPTIMTAASQTSLPTSTSGVPDVPAAPPQLREPASSPKKETVTLSGPPVTTNSSLGSLLSATPKLPLPRISEKAPPTVNLSRTSSAVDGTTLLLENTTVGSSSRAASSPGLLPPASGSAPKRPVHKPSSTHHTKAHAVVPAHIKRRVVSKEFWMKDENAKDCFYCGHAFSAFRRKHHCRTCGQIFDSQCTVLVSGRPFDLPGSLRLCHPCEAVIYGSDDDESTDVSDNDDTHRTASDSVRTPKLQTQGLGNEASPFKPEDAALATPSIGIPVSRRTREGHGGSAVIEFTAHPSLARPNSNRSLRSINTRGAFVGHRRLNSRYSRASRQPVDEHVPFHQDGPDTGGRPLLPAYHNDTVIDPDLAPFMSDDGSEDEQTSMFSVLNNPIAQSGSFPDSDRAFVYGGSRKGPPRPPSRQGSKLRRRNTSIASMNFPRPSPRRSRSQNLALRDSEDNGRSVRAPTSPLPTTSTIMAHKMLESSIIRSAALHGAASRNVELNGASLQHVRRLLAQLLRDNNVRSLRFWEKALLPILLQCTDDVDPNVQRGDDMDVRNYIKLKKVPGGRPSDTGYVSGVVFSKNVALKSMKRNFTDPKILVVTFAIEYARHHQHFISLEPVIAQEREYLRNLVGRVAALKPDILLVQRNVSGLALDMFHVAGITVVFNVKESVLAAVARVTQTVMIRSVDKLSMDSSQLGRCGTFDVRTYVHSNVKKSYIYIAGCTPSLGCTIVLRGANTETLRQVKRITEFMCYVVYNLRLETCLLRDESVLIPTVEDLALLQQSSDESSFPDFKDETVQVVDHKLSAPEVSFLEVPHISPKEDIMPPVLHIDGGIDKTTQASMYRDLVSRSRTRLLSSSPFVKFIEPYLLMQAQEQEKRVEKFRYLRDQYGNTSPTASSSDEVIDTSSFELIEPEMITEVHSHNLSDSKRRFLYDVHNVQYQRAVKEYDAKRKQWNSFYEGSNGNPFDPFTHQNIFVLQSLVSTLTSAPCAGPEVIGLSFYAAYEQSEMNYEDDCTLGQYVEDICLGANTPCKTCTYKMFDHHRQYVHGPGQLSVSVTSYPTKIKGLANSILMWSTCKVCKAETTVVPMSDSTWRYSFGKYLELSFWSSSLKSRGGLCPHDIHKDFVRCFGFQEQCVRVQYDSIEIYEVLVPSGIINWAVSADLKLKNQMYNDCAAKLDAFFDSVRTRLASINLSTVTPEKATDASSALIALRDQAESDYNELLRKLQSLYMNSRFYEVVPLNRTIHLLEEKALTWDEEFADFERNYFPSETDIRRLATLQLKKLFLDRNDIPVPDATDLGDAVEMKERPTHDIYLNDEELQSEKAHNMLTSVIEEQNNPGGNTEGGPELRLDVSLPAPHLASRQLSPLEKESVINSDGISHLDLATTVPQIELPPQDPNTGAPTSIMSEGRKDTEVMVQEPTPLNQDLVDRIKQIQIAASDKIKAEQEEAANQASRIPRLAELQGRQQGLSVAPVLTRTQSQPDRVVPVLMRTGPDGSSLDKAVSSDSSDAESGPGRGNLLGEISRIVEQKLLEKLGGGSSKSTKSSASQIPRSVPQKMVNATSSRVTALAKHFEELSRDFERERLRERRMRAARSRRHRANNILSSQPTVEVYRDAFEAFGNRNNEERLPIARPANRRRSQSMHIADIDRRDYALGQINETAERPGNEGEDVIDNDVFDSDGDPAMSEPESGPGSGIDTPADPIMPVEGGSETQTSSLTDKLLEPPAVNSTMASPISVPDSDLAIPKHEKSSLMKMLSSFWSERSASGWAPLEYPLQHTEHVLDDSDIIVREDEPSSVIALALSSKDYIKKLNDFRRIPGELPADANAPENIALHQSAIEAALVSETGTHMKYSFGHNQVRAQCKIFYAESFDALRRKCGVSERFVESLSRSIKWDSKGGKTRSLFLKTLDDRFVIKSLQEVELKAFTRFAPDYFAFMAHSLFHGVPSVIAKMFGVFQVLMKNPATGVEFNSYLLVMENLFYDRKPTRRFDLKGSMRNRKIESTGQPDEVLLDENLVETIFEKPLFVREHARKLVKASVWNDTMWLCKQNVMDYSLMAGFDDAARTLTVGIIDCIRTYTWDKKLESWIKDRGKNKPTITSPKDYRNRFRVSMLQYVLQAPNVYHEFSRHVLPAVSLRAAEMERERDRDRDRDRDQQKEQQRAREGEGERQRERERDMEMSADVDADAVEDLDYREDDRTVGDRNVGNVSRRPMGRIDEGGVIDEELGAKVA